MKQYKVVGRVLFLLLICIVLWEILGSEEGVADPELRKDSIGRSAGDAGREGDLAGIQTAPFSAGSSGSYTRPTLAREAQLFEATIDNRRAGHAGWELSSARFYRCPVVGGKPIEEVGREPVVLSPQALRVSSSGAAVEVSMILASPIAESGVVVAEFEGLSGQLSWVVGPNGSHGSMNASLGRDVTVSFEEGGAPVGSLTVDRSRIERWNTSPVVAKADEWTILGLTLMPCTFSASYSSSNAHESTSLDIVVNSSAERLTVGEVAVPELQIRDPFSGEVADWRRGQLLIGVGEPVELRCYGSKSPMGRLKFSIPVERPFYSVLVASGESVAAEFHWRHSVIDPVGLIVTQAPLIQVHVDTSVLAKGDYVLVDLSGFRCGLIGSDDAWEALFSAASIIVSESDLLPAPLAILNGSTGFVGIAALDQSSLEEPIGDVRVACASVAVSVKVISGDGFAIPGSKIDIQPIHGDVDVGVLLSGLATLGFSDLNVSNHDNPWTVGRDRSGGSAPGPRSFPRSPLSSSCLTLGSRKWGT